MQKIIAKVLGIILAFGLSMGAHASVFGLGVGGNYSTLDDSDTLPIVGGKIESDAAIGAHVLGHLNLGEEGFLQYFATELLFGVSEHKVKNTGSTGSAISGGKMRLYQASWTLLWMMLPDWSLCPYVGGGVAYLSAKSESKGDLTAIKYDTKTGIVAQGGVVYKPYDEWGISLDVKKTMVDKFKTSFTYSSISDLTHKNTLNPLTVGLTATFFFD